jgi:spermidine synthase
MAEPALQDATLASRPQPAEVALLASVFVVAACGLVYELVAGALASYLLGDSVLQFSTIIGTYLFAMGVGSYLSRFYDRQLIAHFLRIELMVGVLGGLMPAALFVLHSVSPSSFRFALYGLVGAIGVLAGLEIPLVMRILKRYFQARYALKNLVSEVLTFDYLGALAVSIAFPLLLVPHLGLVRSGLLFGLLNVVVAIWALVLFRGELRNFKAEAIACAVALATLLIAFWGAERITTWAEDRFYADPVIFTAQSPYQRLVVTGKNDRIRLHLNGNLQFDSRDEYRYHEALVHPAMIAAQSPRQVLILGGGDGMAAREVLKYPSVEQVTLVELDPQMTELFSRHQLLRQLNSQALQSPKVQVVHADAFGWLERNSQLAQPRRFDVVIVDFPDPTNFSIGKLYTQTFYQLLQEAVTQSGWAVVQTTSPLLARKSFWTVAHTLEAAGWQVTPYHAHVPSFGEWGFILAAHRSYPQQVAPLPAGLKFLTPSVQATLFDFPPDMARLPTQTNRLSNQNLVRTFEAEWGRVQ